MSDKPEFKKTTAEEMKTKFLPQNYQQVEKEILEATKEGKESKVTHLLSDPPQVKEDQVKEQLDKVLEETNKETPDAKPPEAKEPKEAEKAKKVEYSRHLINSLRKNDRSFNRTCGKCAVRKPLEDFYRGKTDNICIDCK